MNKKTILALGIGALALSAIGVSAQEATVDATVSAEVQVTPAQRPGVAPIRKTLLEEQKAAREKAAEVRKATVQGSIQERADIRANTQVQVKQIRAENGTGTPATRAQIKDVRVDARADVKENRQEMVETLKANQAKKVEALKENREKMKAELEARKKAMTAELQAKKDERKEKLEAAAKERVKKQLENIFNRLDGRITSITEIDAKIAARLNVLGQRVDVTAATALYVSAQAALEKAKTDVSAAKAIATEQANSETSKETLRTLVTTAETSIKAAGEAYKKVIDALRAIVPPAPAATVTTETNTEATVQ